MLVFNYEAKNLLENILYYIGIIGYFLFSTLTSQSS